MTASTVNYRELTAFPDDMRAYLAEESPRSLIESRSLIADAYLYHPDDPLDWDEHDY